MVESIETSTGTKMWSSIKIPLDKLNAHLHATAMYSRVIFMEDHVKFCMSCLIALHVQVEIRQTSKWSFNSTS